MIPLLTRGLCFVARKGAVGSAGRMTGRKAAFDGSISTLSRPTTVTSFMRRMANASDEIADTLDTVESVVNISAKLLQGIKSPRSVHPSAYELSESILIYNRVEGADSKTSATLALQALAVNDDYYPLLVLAANAPGRYSGDTEECAAYVASLFFYHSDPERYMELVTNKSNRSFNDLAKLRQVKFKQNSWSQFLWNWTIGWGGWTSPPEVTFGQIMDEIKTNASLLDLGAFLLHVKQFMRHSLDKDMSKATFIEEYDTIGLTNFAIHQLRSEWSNDRLLITSMDQNYSANGALEYISRIDSPTLRSIFVTSMSSEFSNMVPMAARSVVARVKRALDDSGGIISPIGRQEIYEQLLSLAERVKRDML